METTYEIIQPGQTQKYAKKTSDDLGKFYSYHNEPQHLSNQKNFVYQAEIGD